MRSVCRENRRKLEKRPYVLPNKKPKRMNDELKLKLLRSVSDKSRSNSKRDSAS